VPSRSSLRSTARSSSRRIEADELVGLPAEVFGADAIDVPDGSVDVVHDDDLGNRLDQRAPARFRVAQRARPLVEQLLDPHQRALAARRRGELDQAGRLGGADTVASAPWRVKVSASTGAESSTIAIATVATRGR
jgi:hypothetical protein